MASGGTGRLVTTAAPNDDGIIEQEDNIVLKSKLYSTRRTPKIYLYAKKTKDEIVKRITNHRTRCLLVAMPCIWRSEQYCNNAFTHHAESF